MKNKMEIKLQPETRVYDGYFKVDSVVVDEFEDGIFKDSYTRLKLTRPNAVTVLVFNEDTKKVTLVKQFRFPIIHHSVDNVIEAVAGKIDGNESPTTAAVRELHEEVGYLITEDRLSNPIEIYASPGYSTEKIFIFLAVVKNSDKDPNAGGGVQGEHENIEIIEMDLNEFLRQVKSNEIKDSKTIIAANLIKI